MFVEMVLGVWDEIRGKLIETFETIKPIFSLSLDFSVVQNSGRLHSKMRFSWKFIQK